jgi:glutamate 5-kinase
LLGLLHQGVIPIVNENDVVSVDEIRLGDNDTLAALVSVLVDADVLVLCTTVNGLRKPTGSANRTERIPHLTKVDGQTLALTQGKGSALSTGGMATKLQAAATAGQAGVMSLIVDGRRPDTLRRALAGEDIGTWVVPPQATNRVRGKRKHWIAFFHKPQGRLQVDTGAEKALQTQGKSLLPVGIQKITGQFEPGAVVEVANQRGHVFASGLSAFSSSDLERILGLKSSEIPERLGPAVSTEVIHRDNLVLYSPTGSSHAEIH